LFISPFLLLFAVSVFFLNHVKLVPGAATTSEAFQGLVIPDGIAQLQGGAAIPAARDILRQINLDGEIGSARSARQNSHFLIQVLKPGLEVSVDVDLGAGQATVSKRRTSLTERLAYLHKMPGPHNVDLRGNWLPTMIWRLFADVTVYLVLFLTFTGLYLWWVLRAERRIGLVMLSLGLVTFIGCVHALLH
jgi:hypothetical protein